MKFEIVELEEFSGNKASVYSVWVNDESTTLFDQFVEENQRQYPQEIQSIVDRIEIHDPVVHCLDYGLWQGVLLPQERVQEDVGRSCVRHLCQLQDGNGGMDRRNRFLVKVLATFTMILARISASLMVVVGSSHSGKSTPLNQAAGLKKPLLKAL